MKISRAFILPRLYELSTLRNIVASAIDDYGRRYPTILLESTWRSSTCALAFTYASTRISLSVEVSSSAIVVRGDIPTKFALYKIPAEVFVEREIKKVLS